MIALLIYGTRLCYGHLWGSRLRVHSSLWTVLCSAIATLFNGAHCVSPAWTHCNGTDFSYPLGRVPTPLSSWENCWLPPWWFMHILWLKVGVLELSMCCELPNFLTLSLWLILGCTCSMWVATSKNNTDACVTLHCKRTILFSSL